MAKNVKKKKVEKSAKELKKELEEKSYGQKNKKGSQALKKQLLKLDQAEKHQRIKKDNKAEKAKQAKLDKENKKADVEQVTPVEVPRSKLVCRFLIDALNKNVTDYKCPINCPDIHSLKEVTNDVELSLEEYIELSRLNISTSTPMTEEEFLRWRKKKDMEDKMHSLRVKALSENKTGTSLFCSNPEIFEYECDEEEDVEDIDYKARNESEDNEDE
ncbi:hypothetical protein SLOPH_1661 [Spraguea lophii 42_110]|uniref:ZC3H15/TMA46 family C-terminal domain-containing protein n=1 Tax=Spraguea lophii (strain 42_110) TaxID=1358809 RepID=S7XH15_SPRLO|nr:hypothetical protein SLOPH_1661 [Spraguea lophii 42_110]